MRCEVQINLHWIHLTADESSVCPFWWPTNGKSHILKSWEKSVSLQDLDDKFRFPANREFRIWLNNNWRGVELQATVKLQLPICSEGREEHHHHHHHYHYISRRSGLIKKVPCEVALDWIGLAWTTQWPNFTQDSVIPPPSWWWWWWWFVAEEIWSVHFGDLQME